MPNTPVWGQNTGIPNVMDDQDLITAAESGSVISFPPGFKSAA